MPAFDVVEDIRSRFGSRPILPSIHPLAFEHAEETLGRRIIGTTAHRTHAAGNVVRRQELLIFVGRKLTPAIGMENDGRPGRSLPHRLHDEVPVLSWTHRPTHDHPRIQIQHDTEIEPVFGGADVRDVGDPFGSGRRGREVPLQMIAGSRRRCP